MNNKAKSSIFFVILLLLISLGATGFYYFSYEQEKKSRQGLEEQLNSLKHQKDKIEKQLIDINKEKSSLEIKIKGNEKIIFDLNQKLTTEIKAKESFMNEQRGLQEKVIQIEQEKNIVNDRLKEKLKELDKIKRQLETAILEKEKLETAVLGEGREKTEDLEKIVVTSPEGKPSKPSIQGEVLLINHEHKFLILDVGTDNGIKLGDTFEVFHNNATIGNVQIEKLHPATSAAKFLEGFAENQVSEGDLAKRIN